jgi:DNA (cytosine-5)-methyltransferase 1
MIKNQPTSKGQEEVKRPLLHLDLFSGVGGFSLAADWAFGDVEHIFVENDEFCQKVLQKHWPLCKIYGDIKDFSWNKYVHDVEAGGLSDDLTPGVSNAEANICGNFTQKTGRNEKNTVGSEILNLEPGSLNFSEDGVPVAEKQSKNSLPSTISMEGETKTEDREVNQTQITANESLRKQTEQNSKFFATTATNQNHTMGSVPIQPNSKIYGDIRELSADRIASDTNSSRLQEPGGGEQTTGNRQFSKTHKYGTVDLITGGFPCQPFSAAGKRKGTEDSRHLWPQMRRIIEECKPTWVVGENVRGILNIEGGMVFEQVCLDLEGLGYEVQTFVIPACAVNAPHRRDRVWSVAHSTGERRGAECGNVQAENGRPSELVSELRSADSDGREGNAPDPSHEGLQGGERPRTSCESEGASRSIAQRPWDENWPEVAAELCGVDDGLPVELHEFKLTKAGHRVARLKALGNAIVPQVAYEILKTIKILDSII